MKTNPKHNERIAKITFGSVYAHYVTKVEKKGRTKEEEVLAAKRKIDNALTKQVRYLDKLVDALAQGRKMEKTLR